MSSQNKVLILENNIVSAETAGIYVQGKNSMPVIKGNKIKYCRASGVITNMDVDSYVRLHDYSSFLTDSAKCPFSERYRHRNPEQQVLRDREHDREAA